MQKIVLVLGCLASATHGRRVAFNPSGAGAGQLRRSEQPVFPASIRSIQHPAMQSGAEAKPFNVKDLAGITEPLGFWDPFGLSEGVSEGRLRFYREVELKHGRLGMLAALGFFVGEQWHPLFGGGIDVPSYLAFQQTPLEKFWGLVVATISVNEIYSVFTFNNPAGGEPWSVRSDHEPGNLLFDPLELRPEDPEEWLAMQNKELNNGRLAMFAAATMVAQEMHTGQKLFR